MYIYKRTSLENVYEISIKMTFFKLFFFSVQWLVKRLMFPFIYLCHLYVHRLNPAYVFIPLSYPSLVSWNSVVSSQFPLVFPFPPFYQFFLRLLLLLLPEYYSLSSVSKSLFLFQNLIAVCYYFIIYFV